MKFTQSIMGSVAQLAVHENFKIPRAQTKENVFYIVVVGKQIYYAIAYRGLSDNNELQTRSSGPSVSSLCSRNTNVSLGK